MESFGFGAFEGSLVLCPPRPCAKVDVQLRGFLLDVMNLIRAPCAKSIRAHLPHLSHSVINNSIKIL